MKTFNSNKIFFLLIISFLSASFTYPSKPEIDDFVNEFVYKISTDYPKDSTFCEKFFGSTYYDIEEYYFQKEQNDTNDVLEYVFSNYCDLFIYDIKQFGSKYFTNEKLLDNINKLKYDSINQVYSFNEFNIGIAFQDKFIKNGHYKMYPCINSIFIKDSLLNNGLTIFHQPVLFGLIKINNKLTLIEYSLLDSNLCEVSSLDSRLIGIYPKNSIIDVNTDFISEKKLRSSD